MYRQVHAWRTLIKRYETEPRGGGGTLALFCSRAVCRVKIGSTFPYRQRCHYKSWQSCWEWMKPFCPDGIVVFWGDSALVHRGSLDGLMSMKMLWIIFYRLHSHWISTQEKTYTEKSHYWKCAFYVTQIENPGFLFKSVSFSVYLEAPHRLNKSSIFVRGFHVMWPCRSTKLLSPRKWRLPSHLSKNMFLVTTTVDNYFRDSLNLALWAGLHERHCTSVSESSLLKHRRQTAVRKTWFVRMCHPCRWVQRLVEEGALKLLANKRWSNNLTRAVGKCPENWFRTFSGHMKNATGDISFFSFASVASKKSHLRHCEFLLDISHLGLSWTWFGCFYRGATRNIYG